MRAARYHEYGAPDRLRIDQIQEPHARGDELRIVTRAAGVNPSDWKRLEGQYRAYEEVSFPAGVGVEAAGIVDELGPHVSGVSIGDAVFGFGRDTMADKAILTHWIVKPPRMPFSIAGALPVITDTAMRALDELGIRSGETLLVSGAAGGVGSAVVQFARVRGIRVIGTASEPKHDYLRGLDATPTTYGAGLAERVKQLAPDGVDGALDVAGSGVIPDLIDIVGVPSKVLSVADFSAEQYGAKFSHGPPENPQQQFAEVARLWIEGEFDLHLERTFPLDQITVALCASAAKRTTGKLVVVMP